MVILFAQLHSLESVGKVLGLLEQLYTRTLTAIWRVNPAALFDRQYYRSMNPDVCRFGMNPLFHFLRYGAAEGRRPHPLFDPKYYLEQNPDVARSGHNPLLHFLRFGGLEGRSPHPDFNSAFYLAANPDVAQAHANPLMHFIMHGAAEGRLPHPEFDSAFYLAANPDVTAAQLLPVLHFAEHGAAEGRLFRRETQLNRPLDWFLPSSVQPRRPPDGEIDVVIPVFKGLVETEACLAAVLSSRGAVRFRVVVVNDCSPEPKLTEQLRQLARDGRIVLIENEQNLGFVRSVNAGMRGSNRDVVLLNSDTLVFGDWLDRLRVCAYAEERTGTVTPFSNNATVCSYPVFCASNHLEPSTDLAALDAVFASVNRGRSVEIPTAVGFCMYIRRECLAENGLFDADAFGIGYGEENDFCMRTAARGWKHKLACDVFVYHAGSVSFGPASARQEAAMRVLIDRYPSYPAIVRRHVQMDPANAFRIAVTAQRIRNSGKRARLAVVHTLGGGVAQHARHVAELTSGETIWLTLRPVSSHACVLECGQEDYRFSLTIDPHHEHDTVVAVLKACGVERIHIHHQMEHTVDLARLVQDVGAPFDFTVHDYYTVCPQVTLSDEHGRYCSEPDERGCNACIQKRPPRSGAIDISSWRVAHSWVLLRADRVIAPTADTAARIARYYPEARIVAAEHPGAYSCGMVVVRPLEGREPLRVAVLGTQTIHKGYELLRECASVARRGDLPLAFTLIGSVEAAIQRDDDPFSATGPYEETELPAMLERVAPHIVWFPVCVPETFSYTLSTCLASGLPVAAHDIGAFPERLGNRPWSWIMPYSTSGGEWVEAFLRIRREHFLTGSAPVHPAARDRARVDFYMEDYLAAAPLPDSHRQVRPRSRFPITIAAAVASDREGRIQACGYVRVVQPLTHPAVADTVRLAIRSPRDLPAAEADVILVQRVAIQDMETAERVVDSARRRGSRLVFETDDDLFHIPPEHPESEHYARITQAAKWLAGMADAVITSTGPLQQQLCGLNANVVVLPNFLDDRLWLPVGDGAFDADEIRILYAGTVSHRDDLEFLGCAVRRLGRRIREKIRIDVVGVNSEAADWYHPVPVPGGVAVSYPRYVEWIRSRNLWHWGVAPLLDTPFNRSKSALKFLEYSALGLPSICSDVGVYRQAVQPGETGILASNDPDTWREALEMTVCDEALWRRLRGSCRTVAEENTLAARAQQVKTLWTSLLSGVPADRTAVR